MYDGYISGAGNGRYFIDQFVIKKAFAADGTPYQPPVAPDYKLVSEAAPSAFGRTAKTAGILGGLAALVFLATRNK